MRELLTLIAQYAKQNNRRRNWRKLVQVLACVVVFFTTYALILPAITMEKTTCGVEEHTHSENCYEVLIPETVNRLSCVYDISQLHVHSDGCYDESEKIICGFADFVLHQHDTFCFDEDGNLICAFDEIDEHQHTEECYKNADVESKLICGKAVLKLHSHNEECYKTTTDDEGNEKRVLICPELELHEHNHGKACLAEEFIGEPYCTNAEGHTHSAECYTTKNLICDKQEHIHNESCTEQDEIALDEGETVTEPEEETTAIEDASGVDEEKTTAGKEAATETEEETTAIEDDSGVDEEKTTAEKEEVTEHEEETTVVDLDTDIDEETTVSKEETTENDDELTFDEEKEDRIYTYAKDNLFVKVQLSNNSSVPENATLVVKEVEADNSDYTELVQRTEDAVDELPANIILYDISFYTADGKYLKVSDEANVTMGFLETPTDSHNVQVLHFEDGNDDPKTIGSFTFEEKEVEIPLSDLNVSEFEEEEEILQAIDKATEKSSEEKTVTLERSVIEFESEGFSVFAVVDIQTDTYTGEIIKNHQTGGSASQLLPDKTNPVTNVLVKGLDNGVYIILNYAQNRVMTSSSVTVNDFERLRGGGAKQSGGFVTVASNKNVLWKFIPVSEGVYHIQSVDDPTRYLHIAGAVDILTTSHEPQNIVVVKNGSTGEVSLGADAGFSTQNETYNYFVNFNSGNFLTWTNHDDNNSRLFLAEYKEGYTQPEDLTTGLVYGLNGKSLIISGVNFSRENSANEGKPPVVLTNSILSNGQFDGQSAASYQVSNEKLISVVPQNSKISVWNFETTVTYNGTTYNAPAGSYYIHVPGKADYLNITSSVLKLGAPQALEVRRVPVSSGFESYDITNIVTIGAQVSGTYQYINLASNHYNSDYGAWWDPDRGSQLVLTEHSQTPNKVATNLDGRIGVIVGVNQFAQGSDTVAQGLDYGTTYPALSSVFASGTSNNLIGKGVEVTRADYSVSTVSTTDSDNNLLWEFIRTDADGVYYIRQANYFAGNKEDGGTVAANTNAGKYLSISSAGLFLSDTPVEIEIVCADTSGGLLVQNDVVYLRDNKTDTYYLNLVGNHMGNNFGVWTVSDHGSQFVIADDFNDDGLKEIISDLEKLPLTESFNAQANGKASFEEETAYRDNVKELAEDLWNKYFSDNPANELTALQKNLIGKKQIDKITELMAWIIKQPNEVPSDRASGVKVEFFNYDSSVNSIPSIDASKLTFYHDRINPSYGNRDPSETSVDGAGVRYSTEANIDHTVLVPVTRILDDGYPVTESGYRLDALFDGTFKKSVDSDHMRNGGGLFRHDEATGCYYYYSDLNAAYFDGSTVHLYDAVVRPEYTDYKDNLVAENSNFLPFNKVIGNVFYDYNAVNNTFKTTGRFTDSIEVGVYPETTYLNTPTDLWFGMTIEADFFQPKNGLTEKNLPMIFDFHGDDDIWVYIDGVKVLDVGGIHAAMSASVDFSTGVVKYPNIYYDQNDKYIVEPITTTIKQCYIDAANESSTDNVTFNTATNTANINGKAVKFKGNTFADYSSHNMKFFYMERGGNISYCGIRFNLMTMPEKSLSVKKEVSASSNAELFNSLYYTFRIVQPDDNNDGTNEPFFVDDTLFEIKENGEYTGNYGYITPEGYFSLKAGQEAIFYNVLQNARDATETKYIVQELIYDADTGQYTDVYINGDEADYYEDGEYRIYSSSEFQSDSNAQNVTFTNNVKVETGQLTVEKLAADGSDFGNEEFEFLVRLGDQKIHNSVALAASIITEYKDVPVGTKYIHTFANGTTENRTVQTKGIVRLKVGEKATFTGLLAGTDYYVTEKVSATGGYVASYSGKVTNTVNPPGSPNVDASSVSGHLNKQDDVVVTVTNDEHVYAAILTLSKKAYGLSSGETATFHYDVEKGTYDATNKVWQKIGDAPNGSITVNSDASTNGSIVLGYEEADKGKSFYYRITERPETDNYLYDDTEYIVRVTAGTDADGNGQATVDRVWKNRARVLPIDTNLAFVNYKSTNLVISKTVRNTLGPESFQQSFNFTVTVNYDGQPFTKIPEGNKFKVSGNVISFSLKNNESAVIPVPIGAVVSVTEEKLPDYTTTYTVTDNGITSGSVVGETTGDITVGSGAITVNYINTCYLLPETGGSGTTLYTMAGVALIMLGALYLLYRKKESRREADFSP